jgi:peptidylprolyl isomerase
MKKIYLNTFLAALTLAFSPLCAEEEKEGVTFESLNKEEVAETLGHLIVRHLAAPGFELDSEAIIKGIRAEKEGKTSPLSEEEYEQAMYVVQEHLFNKNSEENLEKAVVFLKENSTKKGIQVVDEQLQYSVMHQGNGPEVTNTSTPLIHYKGSLLDGTTFASSLESGEPITLPIGQTIPGFSKGMVGMKEGEKRTLFIHPELAYGVSGNLPPNSLLIFEVEVLKADSPEEEVADLDLDEEEFDAEESAA